MKQALLFFAILLLYGCVDSKQAYNSEKYIAETTVSLKKGATHKVLTVIKL